jgi:hypothetical protein
MGGLGFGVWLQEFGKGGDERGAWRPKVAGRGKGAARVREG